MDRGKQLLLVAVLVLISITGQATGQTHLWSQRFGNTGIDQGFSVATDGLGNVFATGSFEGSVDFGSDPLVSAGIRDVFLVKYDANGNHVWSLRFGGAGFDQAKGVSVDGNGNVLITGFFEQTVDFGGGPLVSAGSIDIFLAKYDASGSHLWSQRFGGIDFGDQGNSVTTDVAGNVFVTGAFNGTVDFGGGPLTNVAGSTDIFLAKYNADGNHLWSQRFGDDADSGLSVSVDAAGNVVVTGLFRGTADFGGGPLMSNGGLLAGVDIFLAKYDASGTHQWSQRFGDTQNDSGWDVSFDETGNVIVTGEFRGTVDFGGGPLTSAGTSPDIFLVKYDASGTHLWSHRFGDLGSRGQGVDTDGTGNVFVTGGFRGTVDFGGGPLTSANSSDIFLAKYDANGGHLWSQGFGSTGHGETGWSVSLDGAGNAFATGEINGIVDFGGGPLTSQSIDVFLVKYAAPPSISSIADVGNDQGRWVRINFSRADNDFPGSNPVVLQYEAFRRIDVLPASTATGPTTHVDRWKEKNTDTPRRMISESSIMLDDWEFVGAIPAHGEETYNMVAPTLADSTIASGQHWSVFFIRAATNDPFTFFDSPPDSGFSLDNLAPAAPMSLALDTSGFLTWDEAPEADFDFFSAYGSPSSTFEGTEVLLGYTSGTSFDVTTAEPHDFYHVATTDFAGNEGEASTVTNTITGIPDIPLPNTLTVSVHPNPFNPVTTITYTVPMAGRVSLSVYDVEGRLVETLVDGENLEPYESSVSWGNTRATGIYFVRLDAAGEVRVVKAVLLK